MGRRVITWADTRKDHENDNVARASSSFVSLFGVWLAKDYNVDLFLDK